jgi:hypothetical protein
MPAATIYEALVRLVPQCEKVNKNKVFSHN